MYDSWRTKLLHSRCSFDLLWLSAVSHHSTILSSAVTAPCGVRYLWPGSRCITTSCLQGGGVISDTALCWLQNKGDIVVVVVIPADRNETQKEAEKKLKYSALCTEIQQMCNMKCMIDYSGNNWSHRNSNKRCKETFGSYTREMFNTFTTKDSYWWWWWRRRRQPPPRRPSPLSASVQCHVGWFFPAKPDVAVNNNYFLTKLFNIVPTYGL